MREALESQPLDFTARMAEALLEPDRPVPTFIGRSPETTARRFGVYRNNVVHGLVEALAAVFPAMLRVVGEDWFRAMAAVHARAHPPRSRLLFEYGRDMPRFLETFEPARRMPYLADLARLELAWLASYHAADRDPLDASALAAIPEDRLPELRFVAHPAAHIVSSPFAIHAIFHANRPETASRRRIDAARPETCLVTRPRLSVMVTLLPPGQAMLAAALMAGMPLAQALGADTEGEHEPDLGDTLACLLATGAICNLAEGERS
jgi:hypothetical protein